MIFDCHVALLDDNGANVCPDYVEFWMFGSARLVRCFFLPVHGGHHARLFSMSIRNKIDEYGRPVRGMWAGGQVFRFGAWFNSLGRE